MNKSSKLALVAILVAACFSAVTMSVMLSGPKGDDERDVLAPSQELALLLADRPIKGLDELTNAHPVDDDFIEELEKHYAEYWKVEVEVFVDAEEARKKERPKDDEASEGTEWFSPYPKEFNDTILASERYAEWCAENKIDGKAWIAKVLRIRGFVHVMSLRDRYDPTQIEESIETVRNDPNLPPKLKADAIKRYEYDLDLARRINEIIDSNEPDWGAEERETALRYHTALHAFLASPAHSKFSKAEVDRKLNEAEKRNAPDRDESEE